MKTTAPPRIVIIGAGGHACVAAEVAGVRFEILGFLSDQADTSLVRPYGPWLGTVGQFEEVRVLHGDFCVHVAIGDNGARSRLVSSLVEAHPDLEFPTLVHASASISKAAEIAEGVLVCAGAVVAVGARLGMHAIVNTGASLDHHASLGDYASMAPGARTGGNAVIGVGSFIGMNTVIHHGVKVGHDTIIGSMSLVNRDLPDKVLAYGNPCRIIRPREPGDKYL
jgi:sugar O-acyltransferase (sialic acid O-acetyltransferase NeuD family)